MSRSSRTRMTRGFAAMVLVGLICLPPRASQGQALVLDLTNLIQNIISAVQQVLSVTQQVQQLTNEATQIVNQVEQITHQLEMLADMELQAALGSSSAWGEVESALDTLAQAIALGQSLPYHLSNLESQFQQRFPGYVPPTDFPAQYAEWSQTALDTLLGTLRSAGRNVGDVSSVEAALDSLRGANDSASGRNQLIQVGNALASLQVEEMAKLRQLFAAQINAQSAYLGAQEAKAAGSAAAFDAWVANAPSMIPVSRPNEGLGSVPRP